MSIYFFIRALLVVAFLAVACFGMAYHYERETYGTCRETPCHMTAAAWYIGGEILVCTDLLLILIWIIGKFTDG